MVKIWSLCRLRLQAEATGNQCFSDIAKSPLPSNSLTARDTQPTPHFETTSIIHKQNDACQGHPSGKDRRQPNKQLSPAIVRGIHGNEAKRARRPEETPTKATEPQART